MSTQIDIGAAQGIMYTLNKTKLKEYGGHVDLNRYWALSLLRHVNFVQRKATTVKSKDSVENFAEKREFFDDLVATVQMEDITPELVLNWRNQASTIDIMDDE